MPPIRSDCDVSECFAFLRSGNSLLIAMNNTRLVAGCLLILPSAMGSPDDPRGGCSACLMENSSPRWLVDSYRYTVPVIRSTSTALHPLPGSYPSDLPRRLCNEGIAQHASMLPGTHVLVGAASVSLPSLLVDNALESAILPCQKVDSRLFAARFRPSLFSRIAID